MKWNYRGLLICIEIYEHISSDTQHILAKAGKKPWALDMQSEYMDFQGHFYTTWYQLHVWNIRCVLNQTGVVL